MFNEQDFNEFEKNENISNINKSFQNIESLEREIKKNGISLYEEEIDKKVLRDIMIKNEIY